MPISDEDSFVSSPGQPVSGHTLAHPGWGTPSWAGATKTIAVDAFVIEKPFVYVGRSLSPRWEVAIDLSLPAKPEGLAGRPGACSYLQMTSRQRYEYLEWLASGRDANLRDETPFRVFLAGMEELLLSSTRSQGDCPEIEAVLSELQRLRIRYAQTHSHLAELCLTLHDYYRLHLAEESGIRAYEDISFSQLPGIPSSPALRFALGHLKEDSKKLPARWAFQWAKCFLSRAETTELKFYDDAMRRLFIQRYVQSVGEGLALPTEDKGRMKATYEAVGPVLKTREFELRGSAALLGYWPQATQPLASLLSSCRDQLHDYFVQRRTGLPESECWPYLPVTLWPEIHRNAFRGIVERALEAPTAVTYQQIAPYFRLPTAMSRKSLSKLAERLAEFSLTAHPSLVSTERPKTVNTTFAVYAASGATPKEDACESAYLVVLHLCTSQFAPGTPEWTFIENRLVAHSRVAAGIPREMRMRRETSLMLARSNPRPKIIKAAIDKLSDELQAQIRSLLLELLSPTEDVPSTPFLDKMLGSSWRRAVTPALQLNSSKVARLMAETKEVHALLGSVFQDETVNSSAVRYGGPTRPVVDTLQSATVAAKSTASVNIAGENTAISSSRGAFLRALSAKPMWAQAELEALAAGLELMVGGVIEWANEAAFDRYDAPVLEEDSGQWHIDLEILGGMLAITRNE